MIWCELENISLSFGKHKVISDLTFQNKGCSFVGIVGASGIGKSTLLDFLADISRAKNTGTINWYRDGFKIKIPRPVGFVQQGSPLPPWLTVNKYLHMCIVRNKHKSNKINHLLKLYQLKPDEVLHLFPHELSNGMKARVALVGAMNMGSKILFLDEPFSGVDDGTRRELIELLSERSKHTDCNIFLVSHALWEVMYLCNKVLFLENPRSAFYKEFSGYRGIAKSLDDILYGTLLKDFLKIKDRINNITK